MNPSLPRRRLLLAAALSPLPAALQAQALPPEVGATWPQARPVGSGRLRYLGLLIYDARLWAPAPLTADDWPAQDFALELLYARALDGTRIAERSLDEMRRQGALEASTAERWLAMMRSAFPDVRDGDRLTGVQRSGAPARLYHNGTLRAEWRESDFARRFFGIWLSPQTSEPALREALFGVGSSRVDLQACKLEYSIVSPK